MNNKQFKEANFNTSFVDDHPELINYQSQFPPELMAAAISAAIAAHEGI
jgi:pyruvate carboxylase subunit A